MHLPHTLALGVPAAAAALALGVASAASAPSALSVTEREYAITPSSGSVAAGAVTVQVTNAGTVAHELVVIRTDRPTDQLALEAETNEVNEEEPEQEKVNEIEDIAPGTTQSKTLNLAPGRYALICNIPGHYKLGMAAALEVLPSPAGLPNTGQAVPDAAPPTAVGGLAVFGVGLALRLRRARRGAVGR